jgi:hypothetical protein
MLKNISFILFTTLVLASCTPSAKDKAAEIAKLEDVIKENGKKNMADTSNVKKLIVEYKSFAKAYPTDSAAPMFLMKAAKFYDFISLPDSAIYFYDQVYRNFSFYPKTDVALFSEAFIYENEKHNIVKAGDLYKEYLSKYPDRTLAKSVKFELHNLGKTPEQIMAEMDSVKQSRGIDSTTANNLKGN